MDYASEYNGHNATGMRTHTVAVANAEAEADAVTDNDNVNGKVKAKDTCTDTGPNTRTVNGKGNGSDSRILVFRTSLQTATEVRLLAAHLDDREGIMNWFVDLDDRDKVLRIETDCLMPHDVICTLNELNIRCRPL